MKKILVVLLQIFFCMEGFSQVPNDDCITAMDFGVIPFTSSPPCPNAAAPWIGDLDDLTNVTPSSPYLSMTGCYGYTNATTTLADDIWYKYRVMGNAIRVWIYGLDTVHVNFYRGTNCSNLLPSGCFTYEPALSSYMFDVATDPDTTNIYNYMQISSNVSGKQFPYFVCLGNPILFSVSYYGVIQVNNNVSVNEFHQNYFVSVFPNPTSNELHVNTSNKEQSTFLLFDIASRIIFQESFTTSTTLQIDKLEKGIYLYEVRNIDGSCKKGKIVKE